MTYNEAAGLRGASGANSLIRYAGDAGTTPATAAVAAPSSSSASSSSSAAAAAPVATSATATAAAASSTVRAALSSSGLLSGQFGLDGSAAAAPLVDPSRNGAHKARVAEIGTTAGAKWFHMPAATMTPELQRELLVR